MAYDLVVKDALIVDGTGKNAYAGDVAVEDGTHRRRRQGRRSGGAARSTPTDRWWRPGSSTPTRTTTPSSSGTRSANPSTAHGVTTVLMGNCGYTLAPVRGDDQDYLMGLFSAAEEVPKAALQRFAPFSWETFPDYLDWLQRSPLGVNVLTQVGHSAVRRYVMGEDALERAATDDEIASMVRIVEEAMDAGAAGVSTSQAPHQVGELGEHIPSFFADDAETEALAAAVRRKGKRLLSINPRSKRDGLSEEDRALLVKLAEISGAVVSWNDFGMGTPEWESVARVHGGRAPARARDLRHRTLPATGDALHAQEALGDLRGRRRPGSTIRGSTRPTRSRRSAIRPGAPVCRSSGRRPGTWRWSRSRRQPARRPRRSRADCWWTSPRSGASAPADVMFDVAAEDELQTFFRISGPVNVDESNLERILKSPATLVGISDGGAHLQTFAGGDYTSYFLEHWVREKGAFSLEEGVAALTSRVAEFLGLDRSRHARGREGGRPGDLRPPHRRTTRAADPRRHPRAAGPG